MNNRYIFRGKRKDNKEWVEGVAIFADNKAFILNNAKVEFIKGFNENRLNFVLVEVFPETIGQCTGLKDKNGKWIFEGDILESRASDNREDWKKWIVTFSDGGFCFEREIPRKRKHKYEQNLLCADEIELYGLTIIGTIHDNPELLEVER